MAYNYEYPYTDFNRVNDDWLINKMKELSAEWITTKNEWTTVQTEWDAVQGAWALMQSDFEELKSYINNYFDTLNVSDEVRAILNTYVTNGTLENLVSPYIEPVVGPAVGAWCAANITNNPTTVIDSSLSVPGAAAESKNTGVKITDLTTSYNALINNIDNSYLKYAAGSAFISVGNVHRIINKTFKTDCMVKELKLKIQTVGNLLSVYDYTIENNTITSKKLITNVSTGVPLFQTDYLLKKGHYIGFHSLYTQSIYANPSVGVVNAFSSADGINVTNLEYDLGVDLVVEPIDIRTLNEQVNTLDIEKSFDFNNLDFTNTTADKTKVYVNEKLITGNITKLRCNMESAGHVSFISYKKTVDSSGTRFSVVDYITCETCVAGVNEYLVDYNADNVYIGIYSEDSNIQFAKAGAGYLVNPSKITSSFTRNDTVVSIGYTYTNNVKTRAKINNLKNNGVLVSSYNDENLARTDYTGAIPNIVNSVMWYNKQCCMSRYTNSVLVKVLQLNNKIVICNYNDVNTYLSNSYVMFDLAAKKIEIYKAWNGNILTPPTVVLANTTIDFDITTNDIIRLNVEYGTVQKIKVSIVKEYTGEKTTLEYTNTTGDNGHFGYSPHPFGLVNKGVLSGFEVLDVKIFSTVSPATDLSILGDSFVQGFNCVRYGDMVTDCFSYLIESTFNRPVFISAMGGDTTTNAVGRINTDFDFINSKYCIIEYGVNDNDFFTARINLMKLVNKVRKKGVIPILVTYPRLSGSGIASNLNSWIRTYTNFMFLDIYKITALDPTSDSSVINAALFYADGHPNKIGNQKIVDAFTNQFSFIFN